MKRKIIVFFIMLFLYILTSINNNIEIETLFTDFNKIFLNNIKQNFNNESKVKKVSINYNHDTLTLDLEDYVVGVVACEMPASFNIEALKALSVAARTYAIYKINKNENYVLKSTIQDQCYIDKEQMKNKWKEDYEKYYSKILKAVTETKNEVLTYNSEPIIAFYFSISNGKTENVEEVFGKKLNYLISVDSAVDKKYNYKETKVSIPKEEFNYKLDINNLNNLKITRNSSNRVGTITINDKTYKGTEFRKLFNLKSTDFNIEIKDNKIEISTKGYGHGVGMSEYGANAMANEGHKYEEILYHYYLNTQIMNNY